MKKLLLILFVSISFIAGAVAQQGFESNPKVKDLRKKFFNKELLFTDAEDKAFWPIFNKYQGEIKSLTKQYKSRKYPETDKGAEDKIKDSLEFDDKKSALKKKYLDQFSKVLPVKKVAKIEPTERKFKREVLKQVRKNRKGKN